MMIDVLKVSTLIIKRLCEACDSTEGSKVITSKKYCGSLCQLWQHKDEINGV